MELGAVEGDWPTLLKLVRVSRSTPTITSTKFTLPPLNPMLDILGVRVCSFLISVGAGGGWEVGGGGVLRSSVPGRLPGLLCDSLSRVLF